MKKHKRKLRLSEGEPFALGPASHDEADYCFAPMGYLEAIGWRADENPDITEVDSVQLSNDIAKINAAQAHLRKDHAYDQWRQVGRSLDILKVIELRLFDEADFDDRQRYIGPVRKYTNAVDAGYIPMEEPSNQTPQ